jgi:ribose 1,5-bisphosphokinase PhnN
MIHSERGREMKHDAIQHLIASNRINHKEQNIAEILNDHFLTTAESITNR